MVCSRCLLRSTQQWRPILDSVPFRHALPSPPLRPRHHKTSLFSTSPSSSGGVLRQQQQQQQTISQNSATQANPRPAPRGSPHQPPPATSTTAGAQPFSGRTTPSFAGASPETLGDTSGTVGEGLKAKQRQKKSSGGAGAGGKATPNIPRSTMLEGAPLKGLNIFKGKSDPLALRDEEYPAWLWTLLPDAAAKAKQDGGEAGEGDMYAKSAKQRRKAAKAQRKREALMASMQGEPEVPVHEQSVDLPAGDRRRTGMEAAGMNMAAANARQEITKALRNKRRAAIKEANFLKSVS